MKLRVRFAQTASENEVDAIGACFWKEVQINKEG